MNGLRILKIGLILLGLGLSTSLRADTVARCLPKVYKCAIKLQEGYIGENVQVLDTRADVVGVGFIYKRLGSYAMVKFTKVYRAVKVGYPVMVIPNPEKRKTKWAAQSADESEPAELKPNVPQVASFKP